MATQSRRAYDDLSPDEASDVAAYTTSAFFTTALGQPGFFQPNDVSPWFLPAGAKDVKPHRCANCAMAAKKASLSMFFQRGKA